MYKKIVISVFWCIIALSCSTYGQGSTNPFELEPRLPEVEAETVNPNDTGNPFDIIPPNKQAESNKPTALIRSVNTSKDTTSITRRLLLIVTTVLLLLLTILVTLFRSQLLRIYRAFLNDNMLSQLQRERETVGGGPYYFFYVFFMLTAGLFLFLMANVYGHTIVSGKPWQSLVVCLSIVPVFFIVKHSILTTIGYVFPVTKETNLYSLTMIVFSVVLGLCLLPVNLLLAFAPDSLQDFIVYGALLIIASIYIFRTLRGLFIGNKFLLFHKFHFLLYICTVEIAPIIIIVKLLLV